MGNLLAQTGKITNPVVPNLTPVVQGQGVSLLEGLLQTIFGVLILVAILAFFLFFLIGAIRWITSGGDKAHVEGARGAITTALVGLVIAFSVFALAKVAELIFGISLLKIDIGALTIR
ncbi:MAG: hypothetical protein A3D24_00585 [Candidatus Blackburnbacteria bacterium RIFCSPHIGHO2_02_FULL_39_13]|uniref:Uncharacterized protein n=1 Tax=Candidatus Blackburnbacteria bacterium RIFCSPLOWO2_01_FULL_40_20 TaxID=1797519 RepID=A0A1G1VFZ4_9BACT|nr:MAG: hypothetical protein UT38_C0003G0034 [Microgenomates group bacterium GW2011_GWA2_39_19]OGY07572.1 MAG: hypothetical protein A2694_04935 [Candidatus Blackburnbacteria bacterium RIFCSPHIGHO2_01_FULL_40_17]OGY08655.1 MAG: hypothetical protein A3D24_00585 [Candidatus Blackburnbacteria bacterium RIFCSPHIGHO2_02_FULL_39_13]OGY14289.1 MAG: hypothetical protein A3A77_02330 [Candidatus Blackburnbacteria bacterium RIFCSPLOWO2_01_FULL_40_20]OGY14614.1 MAG: hypothetical protein A3I52_00535 [Candida